MLRILYSDLRFLLKNLGFKLTIAAAMLYVLGFVVILKIIMYFVNDGSFITTISVILFSADFTNGTIRNKLISGLKKSEIFVSSVISGMVASVIMTVIVTLFEALLSIIFSEGFMTYNLAELSDNLLMLMITAASVGAFMTMIVLVFGGKKMSYFAGFVVAFFLTILKMQVTNDLYPMNGNCILTGTKLALYTAYDRFSPFMHFEGYPRWDLLSYTIGSVVLIALSIGIGLIIFNRKEIN